MNQPGFIRAIVAKDCDPTKVELAHDSAWRFMPATHNSETGMQLDPIDLAVNKVLASAGRDEPRDYLGLLSGQPLVKILDLRRCRCWISSVVAENIAKNILQDSTS